MQQLTANANSHRATGHRPGGAAARGHHLGRQWPLGHGAGVCRDRPGTAAGVRIRSTRYRGCHQRIGIHTLTLFALSSANWKRPAPEVNAISAVPSRVLVLRKRLIAIDEGVRLSIIGRRDRLPATLRQAITDSRSSHSQRIEACQLAARGGLFRSRRPSIMPAWHGSIKSPNSRPNLSVTWLAEVHRGGSTEVDLPDSDGAGNNGFPIFSYGNARSRNLCFCQKRWPDFTAGRSGGGRERVRAGRERSTRGALPRRYCRLV